MTKDFDENGNSDPEYVYSRPRKKRSRPEVVRDLSSAAAYEEALKYLNIKMYSYRDLLDRLLKKGFAQEDAESALDKLSEDGFVDDQKYAAIYLQNLIEYKTFGFYGIKSKLYQKKLSKNLIERLMTETLTTEVEEGVARRFVEKAANKNKTKEQLIQSMRQKGFRVDAIVRILNDE